MISFSLIVTGSPFHSAAHQSAIRFIQATDPTKHQIQSIFFYGEGVLVANGANMPLHQHKSLTEQWCELSQQYHFKLQACVSAATLRGIVDRDENHARPQMSVNIAKGFSLVGLGELAQISEGQSKMIEFNG